MDCEKIVMSIVMAHLELPCLFNTVIKIILNQKISFLNQQNLLKFTIEKNQTHIIKFELIKYEMRMQIISKTIVLKQNIYKKKLL